MTTIHTLVGAGRLLAHGEVLSLVEYALLISLVGKRQVATGSILVIDGLRDLNDRANLRLLLDDGAIASVTLAGRQSSTGPYRVKGVIQA